ncbi:Structure-specific endonuclease subunit SLX1 [Grifola frondosa]|uniref:Structure-specific endonuclease subunit SLX1 n=1 Tax=Grifola frondosa TaxID=5627 RepID=A0A1C7MKN7_GRIFR|nr:Structure-specific endonuclease subunit SLX1 [Grifola frondosa]
MLSIEEHPYSEINCNVYWQYSEPSAEDTVSDEIIHAELSLILPRNEVNTTEKSPKAPGRRRITGHGVARSMISSHPYNTWPLHVKLFTKTAVKAWNDASLDTSQFSLPPGFTCTTELEGVDGKSGLPGSGRVGPIDISDDQFTYSHLRKTSTILASNEQFICSICKTRIENHALNSLTAALCPASHCTAISHLTCLSSDFLTSEISQTGIIPRGGHCRSCHSYILWGDIIRGCYRRRMGGVTPQQEAEEDQNHDQIFGSDADDDIPHLPKTQPKQKPRPKTRARNGPGRTSASGEGEYFDLSAITSDDESEIGPLTAMPCRTSFKRRTRVEDPLQVVHRKFCTSAGNAVASRDIDLPFLEPVQETFLSRGADGSKARPLPVGIDHSAELSRAIRSSLTSTPAAAGSRALGHDSTTRFSKPQDRSTPAEGTAMPLPLGGLDGHLWSEELTHAGLSTARPATVAVAPSVRANQLEFTDRSRNNRVPAPFPDLPPLPQPHSSLSSENKLGHRADCSSTDDSSVGDAVRRHNGVVAQKHDVARPYVRPSHLTRALSGLSVSSPPDSPVYTSFQDEMRRDSDAAYARCRDEEVIVISD